MEKIKKIFKWIGISIAFLITLFIFLAIVLPKPKEQDSQTLIKETTSNKPDPIQTDTQENLLSIESDLSKTATESDTQVFSSNAKNQITTNYLVTDVVDGDTIKVSINGVVDTVRIIGINTPETVDPRKPVECFGKEASMKANSLLSGKTITLESDISQGDRDKYGRLLRYVFLSDSADYGKYMISNGYAYEYTYDIPYKYQSNYKQAQILAESLKVGLWSPNTCNGLTSSQTASSTLNSTETAAYYTSSYSTSKYYYPASCDGWKSLDPKYLRSFPTLDELLKTYPSKTLSPSCST